jgi:hypothetical protein
MSLRPATYTVLNPDIKPRTMAGLLGLHDLERGVVVCHPVPPRERTGHLARDVLYALGKHPSIPGWPGGPVTAKRLSVAWLRAEQITDVLLVRADLFTPSKLVDLTELSRAAEARTWLLFDSSRAHRRANESLGASPAARVRIKPRAGQSSTSVKGAHVKRWRTPSPWIARAAATYLLPFDQFDCVDARIRTGFENTHRWVTANRRRLTPATTERFLDILTSDSSPQYRYARKVGANSALLQHGLASEILDRKPRRAIVTCDPTYAQAREIRRHSHPASAALKALALLTDLDVEMLEYLTPDQIIPTPSGVLLGKYHIKGAGAAALRAHRAHRSTSGCSSTDRLFTRRQLTDHFSASNQRGCTAPRTLKVKLAKLPASLNIFYSQPDVTSGFDTPTADTCHEAWVVLRLLRLSRGRALILQELTTAEREAGQRLAATHVAGTDNHYLAATDHLLFSQFLLGRHSYSAMRYCKFC